MSIHVWPWSAAARQRAIHWRYRLPAILAAAAFLLQGCSSVPPQPLGAADASDPDIRVPAASYRSVVAGYASQRPVGPLPWTERNRDVTPPARGGQ